MALLRPTSSDQAFIPTTNNVQTIIRPSTSDGNAHKVSSISLCLSAFNSKTSNVLGVPWILDTGATDQVVCSSSLFVSIQAHVLSSVVLPNGKKVLVTHIGIAKVMKSISLRNVLCVPNFSFNLISTKKMAQELNCCLVFFFVIMVIFRTFRLGTRLGWVK